MLIGKMRSFNRAGAGNVAMLTAFMIPAIMALAGFAIDYQFAVRQKSKVQFAMDSAVLAGAVQRQSGASTSEVAAEVDTYFNALIANQGGEIDCQSPLVTFNDENQDIQGDVYCDQPTFLANLMGFDSIDFNVSSTSTYGVGTVDVAFVFDVSGSMNSSSRLPQLKSAAGAAFDTLLPDDRPADGTVRIGIATYNHAVNAGAVFERVTRQRRLRPDTSNTQAKNRYDNHNDARLIDRSTGERFFYYEQGTCERNWGCDEWAPYSWDAARRNFSSDLGTNTCVAERTGADAFTAAQPGNDRWVTAGNPRWNWDDNDRFKWYGQREVEWWGADAWGYGAYQGRFAGCQPSGPVPLTADKQVLIDHVESLTADGGTAGHIGLAWGWYLIAEDWRRIWGGDARPRPYDEDDMTKVLILMTDGDFNTSHPDSDRGSFQQAMALCDQMKAEPANVQVYTVGFQVPGNVQTTSGGQTILEYCASGPGYAFNADNGEQLETVYRTIAQSISDLRISR